MLYCQNLTITHKSDGRALIRDFTFSPRVGEHLAVIGEEGNGKSTLIRAFHDPALISAYAAVSGTISKGGSVTGYLPQEPDPKLAGMPVYEYLETLSPGSGSRSGNCRGSPGTWGSPSIPCTPTGPSDPSPAGSR